MFHIFSRRVTFLISFLSASLVGLLAVQIPMAVAQTEALHLVRLPVETFRPQDFSVYGRAPTPEKAGILPHVRYRQTTDPLPDLARFFETGGTLELVAVDRFLRKGDIVISEILWGHDENYPRRYGDHTYAQWIELYSATLDIRLAPLLFFHFAPFKNYPDRETFTLPSGEQAVVLDAVSNLHLGRWDLPGSNGRRPYNEVVSAYRDITYPPTGNGTSGQVRVPFGSYRESWKATPARGTRNIDTVVDNGEAVRLPYIATPGRPPVPDADFFDAPDRTAVASNRIVINEVRNDISPTNLDWIELKNVSRLPVNLKGWEVSLVTGVGSDTDLVGLPAYELPPGEVLLLQGQHPQATALVRGIDVGSATAPKRSGMTHKYVVDPRLDLPNTGNFTLLLRSASDRNGEDAAIADYAGNGFFKDTSSAFNTEFWPRKGQRRPVDVADFGGRAAFGAWDTAWARVRYKADDGHHHAAWRAVGFQGGLGYDPGADLSISPGTPGYDDTALKTRVDDNNFRTPARDDEYTTGQISISEIMSDAGVRNNKAQWIELYNSSLTEAVNLKGWALEIRNLEEGASAYVNATVVLEEAFLLPNQTLVFVSKQAPSNVSDNRVYPLYARHRAQLSLHKPRVLLLNPMGFSVKLIDRGDPWNIADDIVVDAAGNVNFAEQVPKVSWHWTPTPTASVRRSYVRHYGDAFAVGQRDGRSAPAADGTSVAAWHLADSTRISATYYGDKDDRGTPAHRFGSPLPVELSSFHAVRTPTGAVLITWTTASELNNAGFNVHRREGPTASFLPLNPTLIIGAGTSGEKHHYTFTDTTANPGIVYVYRLEDISLDGTRQVSVAVRLKADISPTHKFPTIWGQLKAVETHPDRQSRRGGFQQN